MSEKVIARLVLIVTVTVLALVGILNLKIIPRPADTPAFVYRLPLLHAMLNGTCSVLLIISYVAIHRKHVSLHKKLNVTAFILSAVFIASYVTYHYLANETAFPKDSSLRPVYLFILITHISCSAIVLPLVLMSFYYGLKNEIVKHRKLTRFSFPIWLYVTITGVIVYLMISPYYNVPV